MRLHLPELYEAHAGRKLEHLLACAEHTIMPKEEAVMTITPYAQALRNLENKILEHPKAAELAQLLIDARVWEDPIHYGGNRNADLVAQDRQKALNPSASGYWFRVALRALIMQDMSLEERNALIEADRAERQRINRELSNKLVTADPAKEREKRAIGLDLKNLIGSVKI